MRNILQYPITQEETIQTLGHVIAEEEAKQLIGGNDLFILTAVKNFLIQNPQILHALVDSMKVVENTDTSTD